MGKWWRLEGKEISTIHFESRGDLAISLPDAPERLRALLYRRDAQILAYFVGQYVTDLGVTRNCRPAVLGRVVPPRMISAFSK